MTVTRLPNETLPDFYIRLAADGYARECTVCHKLRVPSLIQCPCGEYAFEWSQVPTRLDDLDGLVTETTSSSPENSGVEGGNLPPAPDVPELFSFTPIVPDTDSAHPEDVNESVVNETPQQETQPDDIQKQPEPQQVPGTDTRADSNAGRTATKGTRRKG